MTSYRQHAAGSALQLTNEELLEVNALKRRSWGFGTRFSWIIAYLVGNTAAYFGALFVVGSRHPDWSDEAIKVAAIQLASAAIYAIVIPYIYLRHRKAKRDAAAMRNAVAQAGAWAAAYRTQPVDVRG